MDRADFIPFDREKGTLVDDRKLTVQFNPQSLRVIYQASGSNSPNRENKKGETIRTRSVTRTGQSSSLSMDLRFDTSNSNTDVREKTKLLREWLSVEETNSAQIVRFHWGEFMYDGTIDSLRETLDYFSPDGKALRSLVKLSMTYHTIDQQEDRADQGSASGSAGTRPLTQASAGESMQSLAGSNWKDVARANGIDNPRQLEAGTVLDLNTSARGSAQAGAGARGSAQAGASAQGSTQADTDFTVDL